MVKTIYIRNSFDWQSHNLFNFVVNILYGKKKSKIIVSNQQYPHSVYNMWISTFISEKNMRKWKKHEDTYLDNQNDH